MATAMDSGNANVGQYQVRFITKIEKYYVPDTPFSIPSNVTSTELSALINKLLSENEQHENTPFDFLIDSKLLREGLNDHICQNNISEEDVVEIEYVVKYGAPQPNNSLHHDDWVSSVHTTDKWIVTGCYDNTVHLWSISGDHKLTIPGHTGPIKGVAWIHSEIDGELKSFVSVSQDQTAVVWKWNQENNSVDCISICRGHARSVDCVAVDPSGRKFVTGSWDKMLKIWSVEDEGNVQELDDENQSRKRQKTENGISKTKVPIMTLSGHHESVSSVQWIGTSEVCSASWDHTIRLWDVELGGMKSQLPGSKAIFNVSYSPLCHLILSASADRHIRLWDPRVKSGAIMKCNYTSHTGWVSTTHWSPINEHLFISGSHDHIVKVWDTRLSNAPLYNMSGHEEKILCTDWSNANYIMSGAADNTLKIFQAVNNVT